MKLPWKYMLISLMLGLLVGTAAGIAYTKHQRHRWMKKGPEMFLKRIDREVRLTDSQRTEIGTLLKMDREKIKAFHDEIRTDTEREIRRQLTDDQRVRFDALITRLEEKRRKRERR